jgi:hypothetical protein
MGEKMKTETWFDVPGCDGFYQVSNLGMVRSFRNGSWGKRIEPKIMSQSINSNGYMIIGLRINGSRRTFAVHRLVATAFLGEPKKGIHVHHIDGVKTNNHLSNLAYVTHRENLTRRFDFKRTTSIYDGVSWSKANRKWHAKIQNNGKSYHIIYSCSEIISGAAYRAALDFVGMNDNDFSEKLRIIRSDIGGFLLRSDIGGFL